MFSTDRGQHREVLDNEISQTPLTMKCKVRYKSSIAEHALSFFSEFLLQLFESGFLSHDFKELSVAFTQLCTDLLSLRESSI